MCVAAVCAVGLLVGLKARIVYCRMFLKLCCVLLPNVCRAMCAVGVLVGLVAWIACWRMFLILCCFLFPIVCGGCVCSGASSGTKS